MTPQAPYKVKVENFYGPLDLLLHLVKEQEVDITRVALAQVSDQYIHFIEAMQNLDLDLAGEFLTVASQLLLIKSRTLLPPEAAEEEEEEEDASLELIRRLLEYKIYKDRARALAYLEEDRSRRFGRPAPPSPEGAPLKRVEIWDLVSTFARLAKATRLDVPIDILYHAVPIEIFIQRILATLRERPEVPFSAVVRNPNDRAEVIGAFLALLELMKEERVHAGQDETSSEILIRRCSSF